MTANYAGTIEPMPIREAQKQFLRTVLVVAPITPFLILAGLSLLPREAVALILFGVMFALAVAMMMSFDSWKIKALEKKGFKNIELRKDGSFVSRDELGIELRGYLTPEGQMRYSVWLR